MNTETDAIADLALKSAAIAHTVTTKGAREFLVVPDGYTHVDVLLEHDLAQFQAHGLEVFIFFEGWA